MNTSRIAELNVPPDARIAFEWAERTLGGRIESARLQARWARQQWFLDVRRDGGEVVRVVLRGLKSEAFGSTAKRDSVTSSSAALNSSAKRLEREAAVLQALQDRPGIVIPTFYGHSPELGWLLQECVPDEGLVTEVADPERQSALMRSYIDQLAAVHKLDVDELGLPPVVPRPASGDEALDDYLDMLVALYASAEPEPDPLIDFTVWWLRNHRPPAWSELSLCLGDVGPNQFLFSGDQVRMMDFEMSRISHRLYDIGNIRLRTVLYNVPGIAEHIDYYARKFDTPLDVDRVQYYTGVHLAGAVMLQYAARHHPDPALDPGFRDYLQIWGYATSAGRALAELFMEVYGITPQPPELPEPGSATEDIYGVLRHRMEVMGSVAAVDELQAFETTCTTAVAEVVYRSKRLGERLDRETLDELGGVLGHTPASVTDGMRELSAVVVAEPERDLDRRLNLLYRQQTRQEHLFRPFHDAYHAHALRRLDPLNRR